LEWKFFFSMKYIFSEEEIPQEFASLLKHVVCGASEIDASGRFSSLNETSKDINCSYAM